MLRGFSSSFGTIRFSVVLLYLVLVPVFISNALEKDLFPPPFKN